LKIGPQIIILRDFLVKQSHTEMLDSDWKMNDPSQLSSLLVVVLRLLCCCCWCRSCCY